MKILFNNGKAIDKKFYFTTRNYYSQGVVQVERNY